MTRSPESSSVSTYFCCTGGSYSRARARLAGGRAEDPIRGTVEAAIETLPDDLRSAMSNVEIVVEDEPPPGQPLLGPLPGRAAHAPLELVRGVLPDKITIYRGPLERHYGHDPELLSEQIRRVVLHEIAHHFGISDERLRELDRY